MADYGLTPEGFKQKRLTDIIQSMGSRIADQLGVQISTEANSVFGQLIGVFSYEIADLWEQAAQVYGAMYPHTASGVSLDNSAALAGITPIAAEKTTVVCTCYGTNGTQIPYGAQISSATDSNIIFRCVDANAVISAQETCDVGITLASVTEGETYSATVDGVIYSYTATSTDTIATALTAIGSQITSIPASVENDALRITESNQENTFSVAISNNMTFETIGSPMTFECTTDGAITPAIGDLTDIVTTYAGWDSVSNNVSANTGRLAESDTALRQRWNASLYTRSVGMTDSIASALMTLNGVTSAYVYENDSDTTDSEGRPPHSIEAVVNGGETDEIGLTIWKKKAAGIDTFGSQSVSINDSQGFPHTINFNRPLIVPIYLNITVTEYPEEALPPNAQAMITEAVLNYGNTLTVGNDVILQRFMGAIYQNVSGIGYITVTASTNGSTYSSNNISIDARHVATFDATRIQVTIS
jgi:uncharacterized phage protein gp47/JayE